jgi:hypothetical protein
MNEKLRQPGISMAQAIMGGGVGPQAKPMRYEFVPNPQHEGYVIVYDTTSKQMAMELWDEHAKMIYLMYSNLHKKHAFAADEFMYGHIMGVTLAMVHANRYPKVEIVREGNTVNVKMVNPDGTVSASKDVDMDVEEELRRRIDPEGVTRVGEHNGGPYDQTR